MKKIFVILIIAFVHIVPIYGQNNSTKRVAILKTIDKEGQIPYAVKLMIRSKLCAAITSTPGYEGYDRVDVASIMDEQEFQRTGLVDDSQIKKLGEMAGADYILIAEAASLGGSDIIITAKILEVESGRMENASDVYTSLSPAELDKNCRILSGKLLNLNIEIGAVKGEIMIGKDRYVGEYINGKPHGKGIIYYAADDSKERKSYEGDWVNGMRHGQGAITWTNGDKYIGEFDNGSYTKGIYYHADGRKYEGSFLNNKYHGYGKIIFASDDSYKRKSYEGDWVNGKRQGQGTMIWANGNKYIGEWLDGTRHGKGTFYWANGRFEEANWQNGTKEGFARYYFSQNDYLQGYYVNGKEEGKWERYENGRHTQTQTYKNGERTNIKNH